MIRKIGSDQARKEVVDLISRRPRLDYLDIANSLQLDLGFAISVVNELVRDGSILAVEDADALHVTGEW